MWWSPQLPGARPAHRHYGRDLEAQFTAARQRAEELVAEHALVIKRFAVQLAGIEELDGDALRDVLAEAGFTRPEAVAA